jgi:3-methyladenine DNA glycosylase/8-oxoguanine DNA glycosylase
MVAKMVAKMKVREQTHLTEARLWLEKKDRKLAKIIDRVGICTLEPEALSSPFEALAKAIIYQQLAGKAAATIYGRVKQLYGDKNRLDLEDILLSPEETLRSAGCSRNKAAALKDLALKTKEGVVPTLAEMDTMSDEELIERLSSVRGIGPWTVEMLLIFRLGRLDVLPATDYGVRKGFAITFKLEELPTPGHVLDHGKRWKPFRSVAAWYLWRATNLEQGNRR